MPTTTGISTAAGSIRRASRESALRRWHRNRLTVPIKVIDDMLDELEEMNLEGRGRVPKQFEPRINHLFEVLAPEVRTVPPIRTNIAPTNLMDMLFSVQDELLTLKVGPVRRELLLEDGDLDGQFPMEVASGLGA